MNTEQLIKEAAEAYNPSSVEVEIVGSGGIQHLYNKLVRNFLTHAKTQGWELVKVEKKPKPTGKTKPNSTVTSTIS